MTNENVRLWLKAKQELDALSNLWCKENTHWLFKEGEGLHKITFSKLRKGVW